MQFLKNHYEKIILSLVLLGLIGGVVVLSIQVGGVKSEIKKTEDELVAPVTNPVVLQPRAPYEDSLQKGNNPPPIDLANGHRLFNPYRWVKDAKGDPLKVDRDDVIGPGAAKVLSVTNLNFIIALGRVSGSAENPSYQISTLRERADRVPKSQYLRLNDKAKPFNYADTNIIYTVKEVKGDAANPTEVILELEKPEEMGGLTLVTIKPNEPHKELVSREVDLSYPPENRTFFKVKLNDSLQMGGETYKVIAITDRQVIFEAQNKKRTIIDYTPVP